MKRILGIALLGVIVLLTWGSPLSAQAPVSPPGMGKPLPPPPPPVRQQTQTNMPCLILLSTVLLVQIAGTWLLWKKLHSMTHLFANVTAQMLERRLTDLENEINNKELT